jgi:hypothetical protein
MNVTDSNLFFSTKASRSVAVTDVFRGFFFKLKQNKNGKRTTILSI